MGGQPTYEAEGRSDWGLGFARGGSGSGVPMLTLRPPTIASVPHADRNFVRGRMDHGQRAGGREQISDRF